MPRVLRFEASGCPRVPPVRSVLLTGQTGPPVRPVKATGQTGPVQSRRTPAFGLGFVAQPSNPVVLWPNHCKPRGLGAASTPIPLMTWPPRSSRHSVGYVAKPINPACKLQLLAATLHRLHVPDLVLLFLPACGPHLIPSATGSLERSLLVSPLLGGHTGIDLSRLFFTCTTRIKPQPAPAILGQESVHTTLSITHH